MELLQMWKLSAGLKGKNKIEFGEINFKFL